MAKKRYTAEEIIYKLREADVLPAQGSSIAQLPVHLGGRLAACELDLGFSQHVDDVLALEVPSPHCRTP